RDDADVLALHVEEQRTRNRILAGGDGLERRRDARHGGDLQRVAVLVVEAQTEDADGVRVGLQAGQRLGVVAGDLDDNVLAQRKAGSLESLFFHLRHAGVLAALVDDALLEHFAGAVVGSRDGDGDRLARQRLVDFVPGGVRVVDQLAVDRNLGGNRLEDVYRLEIGRAHV